MRTKVFGTLASIPSIEEAVVRLAIRKKQNNSVNLIRKQKDKHFHRLDIGIFEF